MSALPALSGCGTTLADYDPRNLFQPITSSIEVTELHRQQVCGTQGSEPRVRLLLDEAEVRAAAPWLPASTEPLPPGPYALVEMGERPSGGYALTVARNAEIYDEVVILQATLISPAPGRMQIQMITSPCVLVQLPAGRYEQVRLKDQSGDVVARSRR